MKPNNLWILGDSFSEGFTSTNKWAQDYVDWKGYIPKSFGDIICEEFGYNQKNLAVGGSDNYTIFESLCKHIKVINKDDVVIIGWSDIRRFRIVNYERWLPLNFGMKKELNFSGINFSYDTFAETIVNRDNQLFADEVNNWIHLLNHLCKFKIIHWTPFEWKIDGLNYLKKFSPIAEETNFELEDYHYSEKGHQDLAKQLINIINKNNII